MKNSILLSKIRLFLKFLSKRKPHTVHNVIRQEVTIRKPTIWGFTPTSIVYSKKYQNQVFPFLENFLHKEKKSDSSSKNQTFLTFLREIFKVPFHTQRKKITKNNKLSHSLYLNHKIHTKFLEDHHLQIIIEYYAITWFSTT